MGLIGHVLEAIDDALETGQHPVLRLWSRDSPQALVYNETLELDASRMRLKSVKYPSQRFDVYWCLLKEIHQGLLRNTVSKKRCVRLYPVKNTIF